MLKPLMNIRYDKLKYNEYISYKNMEKSFAFGYPLLDFINTNIKEIILVADDIEKEIKSLASNDDFFLFNIFFKDEILAQLQNDDLTKAEKDKRIKKILDSIENKQLTFSAIIDFCFLYNADETSYDREIDRFIFICNKLHYAIRQPKYTFATFDVHSQDYIKLKDVNFETLDKEYIDFKITNRNLNHFDGASYTCYSIDEFFSVCMLTIFERHYIVSRCENCGKLFVPCKKNDALYCDRISPQKDNKTCKEYASKKPKGVQELYRKIYLKKFARYNRNKDNFTIKNEYETWKSTADKLKSDLSNGLITDDDFEKWLLDNDK